MDDVSNILPIRGEIPEPNRRVRRSDEEHDITSCQKLGYGVGHFYNDLCASMWFTYLMIFLEKVLKFRSSHAGLLMLIGQATDAISTPLVGIWSDSNVLPTCMNKIGRRMSWHIIGTVLVSMSFPFIFNKCFVCTDEGSEWAKLAWLIPFIMIFQFGWAAVQISHLALIPELSTINSSRVAMNSFRYGFTVIANIAVFVVLAWFLSQDNDSAIGPSDFAHFSTAAVLVVIGGLVVSTIFYGTIREPQNQRQYSRMNSFSSEASELVRMHWTSWFGHVQFYQIALLYMLSRLYVNITQVYFPFYVTLTQDLNKTYIGILPMISYLSSLSVSALLGSPITIEKVNKKVLLFLGILLGIGTCVCMFFEMPKFDMYVISMLIGIAQATLLITSLSVTADLINKNTESGAFVYGAMSFLDKLANGIAYQVIELFNPSCDSSKTRVECAYFYRNIMVFVPGACLILAFIVMFSLLPHSIGQRRRQIRGDREPIVEEDDSADEGEGIIVPA